MSWGNLNFRLEAPSQLAERSARHRQAEKPGVPAPKAQRPAISPHCLVVRAFLFGLKFLV